MPAGHVGEITLQIDVQGAMETAAPYDAAVDVPEVTDVTPGDSSMDAADTPLPEAIMAEVAKETVAEVVVPQAPPIRLFLFSWYLCSRFCLF